jgi:hypothetical protein
MLFRQPSNIASLPEPEGADHSLQLQKWADKAGCDLLIIYHSDCFQVEASLLFDRMDGHILIQVPMTPKDSLLWLFRLHPFPLPLFETHHLMPDVK